MHSFFFSWCGDLVSLHDYHKQFVFFYERRAIRASLKRALNEDVYGGRSLGANISWQWRMGRTTCLAFHNVCVLQSQVQKKSAERSCRLATLTKKKKQRSVHECYDNTMCLLWVRCSELPCKSYFPSLIIMSGITGIFEVLLWGDP